MLHAGLLGGSSCMGGTQRPPSRRCHEALCARLPLPAQMLLGDAKAVCERLKAAILEA